jgi:hypothetical protein
MTKEWILKPNYIGLIAYVGHLNKHYSQNTNTNIKEILQSASNAMSPLLQ